ncbi:MAG TPA: efflux transporter outer membrane subunit [Burkholderiales bacterium]|nr:efflux transporter outer membrane subunit [Burkholderiales bacterium]
MNSRIRLPMGMVLATLLAAGCASTDGLRPQASINDANRLAASRSLAQAGLSGTAWPKIDWWKQFGDPQLDALMKEALAGNPSLRVAEARTRRALATAGVAGSALSPQVTGTADITRERFPEHGLVPPPFAGSWNTENNLSINLSYDLDFWSRNRLAYESALDGARIAEVDAFAARLFLSAGVAHAYVQLQRVHEQLDIAEATLAQREQILALTRDRVAAGIDSQLELKQAESALPATRQQIAALREAIQLTRNQLAALLGSGPDRGFAIRRPQAHGLGEPALPSYLPANLVGRRPDVVAQRLRVESARKEIGAARAEFYPNINLTAFLGVQSIGLSRLLQAGSAVAGAGPALSLPVFDGGRLRANLAGKDADYDVAVEQYNQTLIDALRDVVDQLASFHWAEEQRGQLRIALGTARDAYDLALARYKEGIGNYLQVLSAESQVLAQQSLDADLRARELDLSINLIRALGGGYGDNTPGAVVGALRKDKGNGQGT